MEIKKATPCCDRIWRTPGEQGLLKHYCYLDKGHEGDCICGFCDEPYPPEEHPKEV